MEQQYSLSRRTFLAGSAVAAATAGLALSGCGSSSSSEGGKPSGSASTGGVITAACSYKNANYNPIGASSALMLPARKVRRDREYCCSMGFPPFICRGGFSPRACACAFRARTTANTMHYP